MDIYNRIINATDPEAEAEKIFEEFFTSIEDETRRSRLRARHWRIQQELSLIKDPTQRYNRMVEMFWQGFFQFKDAVDKLR